MSQNALNDVELDSLSIPFQKPVQLPLLIASDDVFSPVVEFLASRCANLNLDKTVLEIHPQGDDRKALSLDGFSDLIDFAAMQQQPSRAGRVMVENGAVFVGRNMAIEEYDSISVRPTVRVLEIDFALFCGFNLRSYERYARLVAIFDVVLAPRLSIGSDHFDVGFPASHRYGVSGNATNGIAVISSA